MADTAIDVELFDDVVLPYAPAAEQSLDFDLFTAWEAVLALFPGIQLDPLFSSVDALALADLVDAIRIGGEEPPNPFNTFEIVVDDSIAEALLPFVQALPFVAFAQVRSAAFVAGRIGWGTNLQIRFEFQNRRAPAGVDAIHAWHIAGGTGRDVNIADVEHGWNLDHEDLATQQITRVSTFGESFVDHGTAMLGILLSGDNGVGMVGIAPEARGFLVTDKRENGVDNTASAILTASFAAQVGGVLLIELGLPFTPGSTVGGIPVEFDVPTQKAIRLATMFGVTVVEPAGNQGVNLDAFPFFNAMQPDSPAFVDTRAIMVGGGLPIGVAAIDPTWSRDPGSVFGKRVDCFASFSQVHAPKGTPNNEYQDVSGTSGASAIIAGVVALMQGMSFAATGQVLGPLDIRRHLRDSTLGTSTVLGAADGIGSMPDLRKIARRLGFIRVLPVAGAATAADAMTMVHLDAEDRLVRRDWAPNTFFWGNPLPFDPADASFAVSPQQVALAVTDETTPLARTVTDIVMIGQLGTLHLAFVDTFGQVGQQSTVKSPNRAVAEGRDIAAVRPTVDTIVVVAVSPPGQLVSFTGDASLHVVNGFGPAAIVDPLVTYRNSAGPALVSALTGGMNAFAIDDGGNPHFYAGTIFATIGSPWTPIPTPLSSVVLDPAVRPSLVAVPGGLVALAVGFDNLLHSSTVGLLPPTFEAFAPVDADTLIATTGPVSIVLSGSTLFAIAVDINGFLMFATRPVGAGQTWSRLIPIDIFQQVSVLGGATAFALGASVAVLAVLPDGRPCWSKFDFDAGWGPLRVA